MRALERRYNPPSKPRQYATFTEVPDAAQRRRIDFLAVNLWQSRGHMLDGVEVKVTRPDWQRELAHPKADSWFGVVNHWWIAAPQGVVHLDELPATWGLLECLRHNDQGWQIKVKVKAPELSPVTDWPNWLVLRLLTRVDDRRKAEPEEIEALRQSQFEALTDRYNLGIEHGRSQSMENHELRQEFNEFLLAVGGNVTYRWRSNGDRLAQIRRAVELLDSGNLDMTARRVAGMFREAAASIEAALPVPANDDDGIEF